MPHDLLIFDLDGTLVDSAPDIAQAVNLLLGRHGLAGIPVQKVRSAIGHGIRQLVREIYPEPISDQDIENLGREFFKLYEQNLLDQTYIYDGVLDFLRSNRRKIALVTNKPEKLARVTIQNTALNEFNWLHIVGGDTYPNRKPHPQPLEEVLQIANVKAESALMIGDGLPDLGSARACGVKSIALRSGYTNSDILLAESPTRMIDNFTQLEATIHELDSIFGTQFV